MSDKLFRKYPLAAEKLPKERTEAIKAKALRLAGIEEAAVAPRRRVKRAAVIPIAAAMCAALTVTAGAAGFGFMTDGVFGGEPAAYKNVQSGIFHDDDGNVSIDVDEILADETFALVSVRYTAMNDEGKEWLNSFRFFDRQNTHISYVLRVVPHNAYLYWKEPDRFIGGYTYPLFDAPEQNTDTERHFIIMSQIDELHGHTVNELDFYYALTNGMNGTSFSIERTQSAYYKLDGESDEDHYYIPTGVYISPISCELDGMKFNVLAGDAFREKNLKMDENIYLVMNDGRKLCFSGNINISRRKADRSTSEKCLRAGVYYPQGEPWTVPYVMNGNSLIAIDPADVAGIQIEDKYYSFAD